MDKIFTPDFIAFAKALSLLMSGNVVSGVMKSVKQKTFDWKVLADGVCNYACWLIGCCCTVAGLNIFGGDLAVTIEGTTYTLLQAVELAQKVVYAYWGAKAIENFLEYGGIKKQVEAVDPQTTFNTDKNVMSEAILKDDDNDEIRG